MFPCLADDTFLHGHAPLHIANSFCKIHWRAKVTIAKCYKTTSQMKRLCQSDALSSPFSEAFFPSLLLPPLKSAKRERRRNEIANIDPSIQACVALANLASERILYLCPVIGWDLFTLCRRVRAQWGETKVPRTVKMRRWRRRPHREHFPGRCRHIQSVKLRSPNFAVVVPRCWSAAVKGSYRTSTHAPS
jgi:hypothetical protein